MCKMIHTTIGAVASPGMGAELSVPEGDDEPCAGGGLSDGRRGTWTAWPGLMSGPTPCAAWASGANQRGLRGPHDSSSLALLPQIRSPGQTRWVAQGQGTGPAHPGAVGFSCLLNGSMVPFLQVDHTGRSRPPRGAPLPGSRAHPPRSLGGLLPSAPAGSCPPPQSPWARLGPRCSLPSREYTTNKPLWGSLLRHQQS